MRRPGELRDVEGVPVVEVVFEGDAIGSREALRTPFTFGAVVDGVLPGNEWDWGPAEAEGAPLLCDWMFDD